MNGDLPKSASRPHLWLAVLMLSLLFFGQLHLPKPLSADSATLFPESDAFIASNFPSTNYGGLSILRTGYDTVNGYQRSLVRFELSDVINGNAYIESATLELYVQSASPQFDPPLVTDVYRIDDPWSEQIVDWNKTPAISDSLATANVFRDQNFNSWDVTSIVQSWADGEQTNYGFMLISDGSPLQPRDRVFNSRSADRFPPTLLIEYTVDNDAPNVSVSPLPQFVESSFTVTLTGADVGSAGIRHYDIQYRLNGGDWKDWKLATTDTSHTFSDAELGGEYEFRARGVDRAGNIQGYGGAQTSTIVSVAPKSTVIDLPSLTNSTAFTVEWIGDANGGPPITTYSLYYSFNNRDPILWQGNLSGTSIGFVALDGDGLYTFEVIARNEAGHQETLRNRSESRTIVDVVPPFIETRGFLPLMNPGQ